tara:strand:- start:310 stop:753 length:444 start_codon:yes stop_codon:yes gene_type:complete
MLKIFLTLIVLLSNILVFAGGASYLKCKKGNLVHKAYKKGFKYACHHPGKTEAYCKNEKSDTKRKGDCIYYKEGKCKKGTKNWTKSSGDFSCKVGSSPFPVAPKCPKGYLLPTIAMMTDLHVRKCFKTKPFSFREKYTRPTYKKVSY